MKKRGRPKKVVEENVVHSEEKQKETKTSAPEPIEDTSEMTDKRMDYLLVTLEDTPYWQAVCRYLSRRAQIAGDSLLSIDPFKNPTEMARTQGIRIGLNDLIEYILLRKEELKKND